MCSTLKIVNYIVIISAISLFFTKPINNNEFKIFKVALDPGHGGVSKLPRAKYGDRYDVLSGKFLTEFSEGTTYGEFSEHEIVFEIALKVKTILDLTCSKSEFNKFEAILRRFTDGNIPRIIIQSELTRGDSKNRPDIEKRDDPNAEFRLFDYVNKNGEIIPGRISRINSFKPHLVVSLHCDYRPPAFYKGINPVIAPPYSILNKGMEYLQGKRKEKRFFFKSHYADWFTESVRRKGFNWFLKDISVYFTGFPVNNSVQIEKNNFLGYRHNMVSWQYKDGPGWETAAKKHDDNTQYAKSVKTIKLAGKYWEREKSIFENYRRDGGFEGFGGDNLYASREIIKYILFSLKISGNDHRGQKLGNPYISIWSMPLLVNAVTAYVELGYLSRKRDRFLLSRKQDEIAEGIAAGIYSLFAGIKISHNYKYAPKGKNIDFHKYETPEGNYFEAASH